MKKYLLLSFVLIAFIILSAYSYSYAVNEDLSNSVFRLHVIANSDSEEDQNIKYKVRDELIKYMKTLTTSSNTKEEVIQIANNHLEDFKTIAENVIKENASGVEIEYISEDYQLRMLQNWLEEDAHILDNYKGGEDSPFKPSLTIKVKEKNDTQKVVKAIKNMPGIYKILNYEDQNPYILFLSKLLYS